MKGGDFVCFSIDGVNRFNMSTALDDHCYYVPFGEYNWNGLVVFSRHFNDTEGTPRPVTCHGLTIGWNFPVLCFFVAMVGVTVWVCLDVMI